MSQNRVNKVIQLLEELLEHKKEGKRKKR